MATFEVTAPDGRKFEVTAPEGASQEAVLSYARAQFARDAQKPTSEPAQAPASSAPTFGQRLVRGLRDPLDAIDQMAAHAAPASLREIGGVNWVRNNDENMARREREYQAARGADAGVDWGRLAGNAISTVPLATALPLGGTLLSRLALGAAGGATSATLSPVSDHEQFAQEKLKQAGTGAAFGAAAVPVASGLARIVSPQTREPARMLIDEGVTPTPGQILGGAFQRAEDKASSIPVIGDAIKSGQRRGVQEFNRAMYARALTPIGGNVPQAAGREAVDEVAQQLGSAYNNLLPRLQFRADQQFAAEFATVRGMAGTLPQAQAQQLERILREQVVGKLTPQGNASGATIKEIESELGRLARGYRSDASFDVRQMGAALQEVQDSIRRTLQRANPQHADELARINEGYSVYARIRDAASRQGSQEGVFSPAQFAAAVRAQDRTVGKGSYARGRAPQQDISDAARSVLGSTYPDSGTAGRLTQIGLMGGGYMLEPTIPLALAAASAGYLPGGRGALAALLTRRPAAAPAIAEGVRNAAPLIGVAGAPALYQ